LINDELRIANEVFPIRHSYFVIRNCSLSAFDSDVNGTREESSLGKPIIVRKIVRASPLAMNIQPSRVNALRPKYAFEFCPYIICPRFT